MFDFLFTKIKHRITPRQHGFQSRKSAVLQLNDFRETARLKHSPNLYTVYLDYAKAFDKVPLKFYFANFVYLGWMKSSCILSILTFLTDSKLS